MSKKSTYYIETTFVMNDGIEFAIQKNYPSRKEADKVARYMQGKFDYGRYKKIQLYKGLTLVKELDSHV